MTRPEQLREPIQECAVYRAFGGDCSIVKLVADASLQHLVLIITRALVAFGGQIKLGPAPRNPSERAVATALAQQYARGSVQQ